MKQYGEYITVKELADALHKSPQSIYKGKKYKPYLIEVNGVTMALSTAIDALTTVDNLSIPFNPETVENTVEKVENSTKKRCSTVDNSTPLTTVESVDNSLIKALQEQIAELKADKAFLQGQITELTKQNNQMQLIVAQSQQLLNAATTTDAAPQEAPTEEGEPAEPGTEPEPKKKRGLFARLRKKK